MMDVDARNTGGVWAAGDNATIINYHIIMVAFLHFSHRWQRYKNDRNLLLVFNSNNPRN